MVSYFLLCLVQGWLQNYVRAETDLVAQPVDVVIQQTHGEGQLLMPGQFQCKSAWEHGTFLVKLNLPCFKRGMLGHILYV